MEHIASLGHFYCIRLKQNIKIFTIDKKYGEIVCESVGDLKSYQHHSNIVTNVEITDKKYITNIVISKKKGTNEPWILATNDAPSMAINHYSKRFDGIETLLKNQMGSILKMLVMLL